MLWPNFMLFIYVTNEVFIVVSAEEILSDMLEIYILNLSIS